MTLDEAIKHAEEVVEKCECSKNKNCHACRQCANEHRQLAEWLKELKERRKKDTPDTDGDMVSRQAAIDVIFSEPLYETGMKKRSAEEVVPAIFEKVKGLSSAQPERNYCKDCRKHNRDFGYKEEICPLVRFRGKAQGHEFDYQYCVYFERRER